MDRQINNKQKLEILITEDNQKHLADAKYIGAQYIEINFAFASTLQEAECLVGQNKYDGAIIDVFFPAQKGSEPNADSALNLAKKANELGIPFVYNTAGNHHGEAYRYFLDKTSKMWNYSNSKHEFFTGKMIEAYPKDSDAEKDTKQWNAAINYVILLAKSKNQDKCITEKIDAFLDFAPYGDYGMLTETMQIVLDETASIEKLCRHERYLPPYKWSSDAIRLGWEEKRIGSGWGKEIDWNKEKDCFVSLRATKETDEKWFAEAEAKLKKEYIEALNFIRTTIKEYKSTISKKDRMIEKKEILPKEDS